MSKGFTLLEVLVAVMLTGMLAALALAPVVGTVSRVVQTQKDYRDISALARVVKFIERDLNSAIRLAPVVINIIDHEALNRGDDDILMIMSISPALQNQSAGTLVYKIEEGGLLHNNVIPGLYRWVLSGKTVNMIKADELNGEDGQLVLPGLKQFRVEVPRNSRMDDNSKNYRGKLPAGVYIKLSRSVKHDLTANNNETKNNERDEFEDIIVFP